MFVLKSTMEAKLLAARKEGMDRALGIAARYGEALHQVIGLQKQLAAWLFKDGEITPEQAAQLFYAQNSEWQASFFNCMQEQVQAAHDAMPPARPGGMPNPHPGVPAGEAQWYHLARDLNDSGFETIEAMYEHAKHAREKSLSAA